MTDEVYTILDELEHRIRAQAEGYPIGSGEWVGLFGALAHIQDIRQENA